MTLDDFGFAHRAGPGMLAIRWGFMGAVVLPRENCSKLSFEKDP